MRKAPSCSRSCAYRLLDSSFLSRVRSFVSLHPSSRRHSHVVRCEVATWRAGVCGLCVRGAVHVHAVIGVFVSVRGLTSATTFDLWASEKRWLVRDIPMAKASQPSQTAFRTNARTDARPFAAATFNRAKSSPRAVCSSRLERASQLRGTVRGRFASDSECACASATNVLRRKNAFLPSLRRANCAWFITRL